MYGDPNVALGHFQRAANSDPNYLLDVDLCGKGLLRLGETTRGTEGPRAGTRSRHEQDHLAKLYLGLVLGQDGDRPRGLREIEAGLRGLGDWLDYVERY